MVRIGRVGAEIVNDTGFLYTDLRPENANFSAMKSPGSDTRLQAAAIADRFVQARLKAAAMRDFPGSLPSNLDGAYAIQAAAISRWPDTVAGWKVAMLDPRWKDRLGEERLVGPVFRAGVRTATGSRVVEFPVFENGFAAVEAEFIFRLGADAPAAKTHWQIGEAAELVHSLHVGVETAGSPLSIINDLGPLAIVSDFGNNWGIIVGPLVSAWRARPLQSIPSETFIEGVSVGRGSTASVPGDPLAALAFALNRCARLGHPLKSGDLISTGATTGVHQIREGQNARLSFGEFGEIHCRAARATPTDGQVRPDQKAGHSC
jgi:2-keto-4-pentenoate hydratase